MGEGREGVFCSFPLPLPPNGRTPETTDSERPPVWVGHVVLRTRRQKEREAFMRALGIRFITREDDAVILELRGGTHLSLLDDAEADPGAAPFDLMVDDIEATHRTCTDHGLTPSPIEKGHNHRSFSVAEPSGHRIKFFDSHVSKFPV